MYIILVAKFLIACFNKMSQILQNGYKIKVGITEIETIGIDTPEDLQKAEEFLNKNR